MSIMYASSKIGFDSSIAKIGSRMRYAKDAITASHSDTAINDLR